MGGTPRSCSTSSHTATPRTRGPVLVAGAGSGSGPAARDLFERAKGPAGALGVVLVAEAAVFWLGRRGRRAGAEAWAEAVCPACLALGAAGERFLHAHLVPRVEAEPSPG